MAVIVNDFVATNPTNMHLAFRGMPLSNSHTMLTELLEAETMLGKQLNTGGLFHFKLYCIRTDLCLVRLLEHLYCFMYSKTI